VFSIGDGIWDDQRASVSEAAVRISAKVWMHSDGFAHADVSSGMISKRQLSKGTFGPEMHLILQIFLSNSLKSQQMRPPLRAHHLKNRF
jgi:hypothetical protein